MKIDKNALSKKEEQEEQILVTSCKDCVFATYDGDTQNGCSQGKLEIFKNKKIDIVEAEDLTKEFFVVNATCFDYRPPSWGDAYEGKEKERVSKEHLLRYNVGIIVDEDHPLKNIKSTFESLISQARVPNKVVITNNTDEKDFKKFVIEVEEKIDNKNDKIEVLIIDLMANFHEIDHVNTDCGIVDEMFTKFGNGYYVILKSGSILEENSIQALSDAVGRYQYSVPIIRAFDKKGVDGIMVQAFIHKFLGGSRHFDINKKANDFQKADGLSIIRTWKEIFNIYKTGEI
tara:strand:+ start:3226 stop:4089 length:864 start_codon:yes stop_codon:yes gene_type:complete